MAKALDYATASADVDDGEDGGDEGLNSLEAADYAEQDDGSVIVSEPEKEKKKKGDFHANLAEDMDESVLNKMGQDLLELVERDKESRKKRDEQYAEGIKRAGLDKENNIGGAEFDGASRVVHPVIIESCIDFEAAAIKELMPPDGPVKTKLMGEEITREQVITANKQRDLLNWQMTQDVREYRSEKEKMLLQVPLGGSQYMKFWQESDKWTCEFVPIDDIFLPYLCKDFYSASRMTHVQRLSDAEYAQKIEDGFYREYSVLETQDGSAVSSMETTKASEAAATVEGKERQDPNLDGERLIYEIKLTGFELPDDEFGEGRNSYLVSVHYETSKVLSIYRNWEEDDPDETPLDWIVEWPLIPWRGAYAIGFMQIIGSLAIAATGSLRALLDSAHANNAATLVMLKGTGVDGQTNQPTIGQTTEIKAPVGVTNIRDMMMAMPFNPPSTVLFQLLGWLTDAAKGVLTTAEEKIQNASNTMPVGTTLALIEAGAKVMSAVHARMHRSQEMEIRIICRLNKTGLSVKRQKRLLGKVIATPDDFIHVNGVIPVSDPNIFSEAQRFAQNQAILQQSQDPRVKYNVYEVHHRILKMMKVPDIDQILPKPDEPTRANAVSENMAGLMGRPLLAFPEQDHLAHIHTHVRFLMDKNIVNPLTSPRVVPGMVEHIFQHVGMQYVTLVNEIASTAVGKDFGKELRVENAQKVQQTDKIIAMAGDKAIEILNQQLAPIMQIMMPFMQQSLQQMQNQQPTDPAAMAGKAALDEVARKKAKDAQDGQISQVELQGKSQENQVNAQLGQGKLQLQGMELQIKGQDAQQAGMDTQLKGHEMQIAAAKDGMQHELAQGDLMLQAQEEERLQREAMQRFQAENDALEEEARQANEKNDLEWAKLEETRRKNTMDNAIDKATLVATIMEAAEPGNQLPGV